MERWVIAAVSGWLVFGSAARAWDQTTDPPTHARIDIPPGRARTDVVQAIAEADRRLQDPACQQVLADFTDHAGRSLQTNLAALQLTPSQYLNTVWFVDAPDHPLCRGTGSVAAFTQPGSRFVAVCGSRFTQLAYSTREIVVIHEMLHSLGLGENPPTSAEITNQVVKRCARV